MISRNLSRRLERLEDNMLPASEEPTVIKIILITPDGEETDSGIEYVVPPAPKGYQKRRW